jgi:hypothetical protein
MEALGMGYTKYYETSEIIYAIDSRRVPTYGDIKYLFSCISATPHITTVFTIIVVDFPPTYGVVLGRYQCSLIGGYIVNDGICMMLPNKDGTMIRVPQKTRNPISFKKKANEVMKNYIDVGIINYVVLSPKKINPLKKEEENHFQGFWKMSFDGACSKYGNGVGIIFQIPQSGIYPQAIKLELPHTNNEEEYEALIQGMILSLHMKVENMVVTGDS